MDGKSKPTLYARVINFTRTNVIPLFLMIVSPPAVQFVWVVCFHHGGSARAALSTPLATLYGQFPSSSLAGALLSGMFLFFQLILLLILPGRTFVACTTPMGNAPQYKLNGVLAFFVTNGLLYAAHVRGIWRYGMVYDEFGSILAFLNQFALVATLALYVRGLYFPTNSDSGRTGNGVIWDMWQGTELHPEIFGVSLKQLINCRFAMMGWSVVVVAFALKQKEIYGQVSNSMLVSAGLQLLYIFKFFCWESGYFNSVDIIHDRFGFYIFWGCTAFLPSIYTLTSLFLATHPVALSPARAAALALCGALSVWANYDTDRQRQRFRETGGREKVWGRAPQVIRAKYTTGDGREHSSILLASGWWGIARHINYVFEIALALCWTLPAGRSGVIAYVYVTFLTILLTDRAYRDELRCSAKYGKFYDLYCAQVPWRMIPGVY